MKKSLFIISILIFILQSCKGTPEYMDDQKLCVMLAEMTNRDQNLRAELASGMSSERKDSIWKYQKHEDLNNTKLLIKIIEARGWPNKDSLGCKEFGPPMLIFRHAPKEYFNEIKFLIDKEFKEGRMNGLDHAFIDDHLNGRPGMNFKITEE